MNIELVAELQLLGVELPISLEDWKSNFEWPIPLEDWKSKYLSSITGYTHAYRKEYYIEGIGANLNIITKFDSNNYSTNFLLIKANENNNEKNITRLKDKVNTINKKIEDESNEVWEHYIISPDLLEACENFLKLQEAFETFNRYEFGSRMRENLWRPPTDKDDGGYEGDTGGPMYKKYMSHFDTLVQSGQGKIKKKSNKRSSKHGGKSKRDRKKKRGGKSKCGGKKKRGGKSKCGSKHKKHKYKTKSKPRK
jgi:hypothetical protein